MRLSIVGFGLLALCLGSVGQGQGEMIFTGSPEGSWSWSTLLNAGHGESTSFYPTARSQFENALFQDYVTYDPRGDDPDRGIRPHWFAGQGFDTMQVFRTYVYSPTDMTLPVRVGGDDGHSLFANGLFVGGGGYGANVDYALSLRANVPTELELVGYNGPGGWVFGIGLASGDHISGPIDDVPDLRINADGQFATVP